MTPKEAAGIARRFLNDDGGASAEIDTALRVLIAHADPMDPSWTVAGPGAMAQAEAEAEVGFTRRSTSGPGEVAPEVVPLESAFTLVDRPKRELAERYLRDALHEAQMAEHDAEQRLESSRKLEREKREDLARLRIRRYQLEQAVGHFEERINFDAGPPPPPPELT